MSITDFGENYLLEKVPNELYVKLHIGNPGESGTANPAAETARKKVTFLPPLSGTRVSSTSPQWTNVAAAETYTHWSLWDATSGGNCLWTGALVEAKPMSKEEGFEIAPGDLSINLD